MSSVAHTFIKENVTERKGCLMKEHLVRERPKPAQPSKVISPLYLNNTRDLLLYTMLHRIRDGKVNTERLVKAADVEQCVSEERETERRVCRLTVCQTTRSAHPGRGVGFLTEYSYLKPRSLLCGCERDRRVGPDRDRFATRLHVKFGCVAQAE